MKFLIQEITKPLLRRAGTALSVFLLAQDIPQESVDLIFDAYVVMCGVAFDLLWSHLDRKGVKLFGGG